MRCPRCSRQNDETVVQCECGFAFDEVAITQLPAWFAEVKQVLETAYLAAPTPWQQSGKSGSFETWTRLRLPNLEPVDRPGTYLDIGCANGFLLHCLMNWAALKEIKLTPYGLDYSAELIRLARERLRRYAGNFFVANALDWQPVTRFDYVRTELVYMPRNYEQIYIKRLLTHFLAEAGKLIISDYRSRQDDLSRGWLTDKLAAWGYQVSETYSGYDGDGLELCRVAVLPADQG